MMHCYAATLIFQPVDKYMIKEIGDDKVGTGNTVLRTKDETL